MISIDFASAPSAIDFVSVVAGILAAAFAALSAYAAYRSSNAALQTLRHLERQRLEARQPALALEFHADWIYLDWLPNELHQFRILHVYDSYDAVAEPPWFEIRNFGGGVAYDMLVIFELEANADDIPERLPLGSTQSATEPAVEYDRKTVRFSTAQNTFTTGAYLSTQRSSLQCAPGQARRISFPVEILTTLFLLSFQRDHVAAEAGEKQFQHEFLLTAKCTGRGLDGEFPKFERQFRLLASVTPSASLSTGLAPPARAHVSLRLA